MVGAQVASLESMIEFYLDFTDHLSLVREEFFELQAPINVETTYYIVDSEFQLWHMQREKLGVQGFPYSVVAWHGTTLLCVDPPYTVQYHNV